MKDGGELWRWQHSAPPAEDLSLTPIGFQNIEGWASDDHAAAFRCFAASASTLKLEQLASAVSSSSSANFDDSAARAFFEAHFTPFRVQAEPGLLTSYFEPVLKGSRVFSSRFSVPVLKRPPELRPLPPEHPLAQTGLTAGHVTQSGLAPYFTRAEIEDGAISGRGLELLYLDDPVDAFFMHVQGSGMIELDDGSAVRIGFDGKSGYPYTSIGKLLVARRKLSLEEATLSGIVNWLRQSPLEARALLQENKSYIFFKELEAGSDSPRGSLGTPLHSGRSLAADPRYHELGLPIWVSAPELYYENAGFRRLLVAQDTGSAITGPQRGDLFAGSGDMAGELAGRTRHECEFIVLRPKLAS